MDPHQELELVRKAIQETVSGCCEWDEKSARRVRQDKSLQEVTPEGIRQELQTLVRRFPETVTQIREEREHWRDLYEFYYKVIIPLDGFPKGLFVELRLADDDPDVPAVLIVNAHEQIH